MLVWPIQSHRPRTEAEHMPRVIAGIHQLLKAAGFEQ